MAFMNASRALTVIFITVYLTGNSVKAQGALGRSLPPKIKALEECNSNYEHFERQAVLKAAALPPGAFGSTYIREDKGEWIRECMGRKGYQLAFDSLAQFDSTALARMPREQINALRKADLERATRDVSGWK